jgi:ribonucleoside-triphosphate reductase (formate)
MPYERSGETYVKCKSCHEKDPVLRNFQKTEVYSRIVGYIRPVAQWNAGKTEEYKDRVEFRVGDSACC